MFFVERNLKVFWRNKTSRRTVGSLWRSYLCLVNKSFLFTCSVLPGQWLLLDNCDFLAFLSPLAFKSFANELYKSKSKTKYKTNIRKAISVFMSREVIFKHLFAKCPQLIASCLLLISSNGNNRRNIVLQIKLLNSEIVFPLDILNS